MLRKLVAVVAGVALAGGLAGTASANPLAYRYWASSSTTDWIGTRVTVDNPANAERSINSPDFFDTSALADNNLSAPNDSGIQQGVTYEYKAPEQPTCDLGSINAAMYYFVETVHTNNFNCYYESNAATTDQHVQKVQWDAISGEWRAYMDGTYQGHQTAWTACGGNACFIASYAEEDNSLPGLWSAKFAGSGQTPWGFYNGSLWNTINNAPAPVVNSPWSGPTGPFPGGIWSFQYSKF